ncbi:RNA 2',3'-cyclic phosphodiesterase [Bacillus sp. ISL-55]|uniref:RNA 2',3'-cyclic phosphodiesterase n=1 Tax=Bacillus sp. ISL-55 TaxID=2819134 RepID=UPI001BE9227A|nr:RNA 2',3'-cyclic phosphodiesterase [Bacillus sp. ISL-55]MBT2692951.1 RNA 2',3'-cyclic phosphodiesterase [Bacillus sp. ISL-55]
MTGQQTHYFYALELPGETKEILEGTIHNLQSKLPFKTWVHPQDLHITLAFLGNAPEAKIQAANEVIELALNKTTAFKMEIDHLGIFGRKDSPRIFWGGLKKSKELNEIRDTVFSACMTAGFALETRPFSPHITIARKWVGEEVFTSDLLEAMNPFKKELTFHAERVVLYKTHLGKSPKYEPITLFPLAMQE